MRRHLLLVFYVVLLTSLSGCRLVSDESLESLFGALDPASSPDTGTSATGDDTEDSEDTQDTEDTEDTEDSSTSPEDSAEPVDADGDGHPASTDCDDDDPTRYPGAEEPIDTIDHDCDGALAAATALELPAEVGSIGPVELFVRTVDTDPTVVLAWTSERCEDEAAEQTACISRRTWTPNADGSGGSAVDPQYEHTVTLGSSSTGTVLDFAYAERGIVEFIRAVRTDGVTAVGISKLSDDVASTTPFPDRYSSGTETYLSTAESISVDLAILPDSSSDAFVLGIACADGRAVDMFRFIESDSYSTSVSDWTLDEATPTRVDGCAVSGGHNAKSVAFAVHEEPDGGSSADYYAFYDITSSSGMRPLRMLPIPGDNRQMGSSRHHTVDGVSGQLWGINAIAHGYGVSLIRYTASGSAIPVNLTVSTDASEAIGIQHVGVDVTDDNLAPAWLCLVDDDGAAYLGRAEYSEFGEEPRFTQFPVAMDTTATSCSVAVFQGTHVIATFDTSSGPYLAQLPIPASDDAEAPTDTGSAADSGESTN